MKQAVNKCRQINFRHLCVTDSCSMSICRAQSPTFCLPACSGQVHVIFADGQVMSMAGINISASDFC